MRTRPLETAVLFAAAVLFILLVLPYLFALAD